MVVSDELTCGHTQISSCGEKKEIMTRTITSNRSEAVLKYNQNVWSNIESVREGEGMGREGKCEVK